MDTDSVVATPCTRICVVHPVLRLCLGCGRSLDEIARWISLGDSERAAIMAKLPKRLATMRGTAASGTTA